MEYEEIVKRLKSLSSPKNVKGMARFGINPGNTLGVSIPHIRKIAREAGKDHQLARQLWQSGIHEARILASMVGEPEKVTGEQMEQWVRDFDSWDVCDQVCMNLFDRTGLAWEKAAEWPGREEEFVKRAGFVMMAVLAVHDKEADDGRFEAFLPVIKREAGDERNFVRKAINWALRQIGKRNLHLNGKAIEAAEELQKADSKAARWVASGALRELTSRKVRERLEKK